MINLNYNLFLRFFIQICLRLKQASVSGRKHTGQPALFVTFAALLLLTGCSGGGTGTGGGTTIITGSAGDGPITGGTVSVIDGKGGVVVTMPALPKTDSTAHYSFTIPSRTPVPLTVTVTGGKDVLTGMTQAFDLTGVYASQLPSGGTVTLNVNPISTLIVTSARAAGELNAANLSAATSNVLNTVGFGLPAGFNPITTPVTTGNVAAVIKANEATAELIRRTKVSTGKTMAQTIMAIAEDITDGVLDGRVAAGVSAT